MAIELKTIHHSTQSWFRAGLNRVFWRLVFDWELLVLSHLIGQGLTSALAPSSVVKPWRSNGFPR